MRCGGEETWLACCLPPPASALLCHPHSWERTGNWAVARHCFFFATGSTHYTGSQRSLGACTNCHWSNRTCNCCRPFPPAAPPGCCPAPMAGGAWELGCPHLSCPPLLNCCPLLLLPCLRPMHGCHPHAQQACCGGRGPAGCLLPHLAPALLLRSAHGCRWQDQQR